MNSEAFLLVAAVAGVGVLHTLVPDHWVPITLVARQRGWSKAQTAKAAFRAGIGHVLSTLAIGVVVWIAGVAFAVRFGNCIDMVASIALVAFGGWIMCSGWMELRRNNHQGHPGHHGHSHHHGFAEHAHAEHGHAHKTHSRTALLLILGSSPMVEGIPAYFAAGKYGVGLIAVMALVFAASTIAVYILLCVSSTAGQQRVKLGPIERYAEPLSGAFIVMIGIAFYLWPIL